MKDAYYFSHDGNARNDPKMLMLRGKYKNNGYACYFMILEMMRESHNYRLPNNEYLYSSVALGISEAEDYVKGLFCYCFAIGLLSKDKDWVWSESFIRRMERKEKLSKTRRDAGMLGSMKKWQNDGKHDGKMMAVKESKVKESKENTTFTPPTTEQVRAYCGERRNTIDPEYFVDYYTCKGWVVGKHKMKDWKAAVRTWEKNGYSSPQPKKPNYVHPSWTEAEKAEAERRVASMCISPERMAEAIAKKNSIIAKLGAK